jgi:hypothetical protein
MSRAQCGPYMKKRDTRVGGYPVVRSDSGRGGAESRAVVTLRYWSGLDPAGAPFCVTATAAVLW